MYHDHEFQTSMRGLRFLRGFQGGFLATPSPLGEAFEEALEDHPEDGFAPPHLTPPVVEE